MAKIYHTIGVGDPVVFRHKDKKTDVIYIKKWISFSKSERGIILNCVANNKSKIKIYIDLIFDDVIRIRMGKNFEKDSNNPILVYDFSKRVNFKISKNDKSGGCRTVSILTEKINVEISKGPFELKIYDLNGNIVFRQNVNDLHVCSEHEVFPIGYFYNKETKEWFARETIYINPDEAFYGFGEKFTPINKKGLLIESWTTDAGGVSNHRSYKNVPFFMSSNGYGIFVNTTNKIIYEIGTKSLISYSILIEGDKLDYFLIYGPEYKKIIKRYCDLTGYPEMPPKWSFGLWMSRNSYKNRKEVEEVAHKLRKHDVPCDVIHIDPYWMGEPENWCNFEWDTSSKYFPDPEKMIRKIHSLGFKLCLWENSYVPVGTKMFDEGAKNGYFVKDRKGVICLIPGWAAKKGSAVVDFTNPKACKWYKEKHKKLLNIGVDIFKTDFGEWAPPEGLYYNGKSGKEIHNLYPLLYNKIVFETIDEFTGGKGIVWARSAYAGSQRYPVHWGGDCAPIFEQMACQLRGGLSFGMSGVPFYSHDIGGYSRPSNPVIYVRWAQFGLFSSHSRCHGVTPREPWNFGKKAESIFREYVKLRYRLLPYIYSCAKISTMTGLPMMRSLILEYQDDPNCKNIDLQYLFGESFLVVPVFKEKGEVNVYLPDGEWIDYWTKKLYSGKQNIKYYAELDILPLFVKNGSIIPMSEDMNFIGEKNNNKLILDVYPLEESNFTIYEEDKDSVEVSYVKHNNEIKINISKYTGKIEILLNNCKVVRVVKSNIKVKLKNNVIHLNACGNKTNLELKVSKKIR